MGKSKTITFIPTEHVRQLINQELVNLTNKNKKPDIAITRTDAINSLISKGGRK